MDERPCWDGRTVIVNKETGEYFNAGCCRVPCHYCLSVHRVRLHRAMRRAQPTQLVTLTLVGNDWQTIRARMSRIQYRVKKAGYTNEWAWSCEVNPAGTGHHVHACRRGEWLPHTVLSAACAREGTGFPWLSPRQEGDAAAAYLTKYLAKGDQGELHAEYLRLNGGRLVHTSRGWWLDDEGRSCTWREARKGDGKWAVVFLSTR